MAQTAATLNLPKIILAAVLGVILAIAGGLHAASMVGARSTAPDAAAQLFFANGDAIEQAAYRAFAAQAGDGVPLEEAASAQRQKALLALKRDPSSAKALALLALARPAGEERNQAVLAAAKINRRDLALQALVLEAHLQAQDYPQVIETLDQILRVHRQRSRQFFPILGEALRDQRTVPVFVRMLDGSSSWHATFVNDYAVGQPDLLPSLALLRAERNLSKEGTDRKLIEGLVRTGKMDEARALFDILSAEDLGGVQDQSGARTLDWGAQFPPFDWRFSEESDFRAQASRDGERLELFVRAGQGGVIAERILPMPGAPFEIMFEHLESDRDAAQRIRIELSCGADGQPFLEQAVMNGQNRLRVRRIPDCDQLGIAINARAFSGGSALRAKLGQITIMPLERSQPED